MYWISDSPSGLKWSGNGRPWLVLVLAASCTVQELASSISVDCCSSPFSCTPASALQNESQSAIEPAVAAVVRQVLRAGVSVVVVVAVAVAVWLREAILTMLVRRWGTRRHQPQKESMRISGLHQWKVTRRMRRTNATMRMMAPPACRPPWLVTAEGFADEFDSSPRMILSFTARRGIEIEIWGAAGSVIVLSSKGKWGK